MCVSKKATTLAMQLIRSLHLQSELCTNTNIDNFQQLVNSKAKKKKKERIPVPGINNSKSPGYITQNSLSEIIAC